MNQIHEQMLLTDAELNAIAGGAQGLEVVVAATTTDVARPHANSGSDDPDGVNYWLTTRTVLA